LIRVTIVGAGHYGRAIVARKYADCPQASLCGVISPHTPAERLIGTPLEGLPLTRSAVEWLSVHGPPEKRDVFDLCVHPDAILQALQPLVDAGARSFVLPKPIAATRAGLDAVVAFVREARLQIAVASQWHYSRVTETLRQRVATLARPLQVEMAFTQRFDAVQRQHYTPYTALLPHMLQILYTAGIWRLDGASTIVGTDSVTHVRKEILAPAQGVSLLLHTDIDAAVRRRQVAVTDATGCQVIADFMGVFRDGIAQRYPAVVASGHRQEIPEDNIAVMVQRYVAGFLNGAPHLDLDGYLPINDCLIALHG